MDNVIQHPFAGGMYARDADINGENPCPRAQWKLPARPARVEAAGDRLDGQHARALAVGRAGIDHSPAIGRQLAEARVKIIHKVTDGGGGGLGQRSARRINVARRSADVRVLHPERFFLVVRPRVEPGLPSPAVRVNRSALRVGNAEMQVRPG